MTNACNARNTQDKPKLTLPIEIGKKYIRRDGEVVTACDAGKNYVEGVVSAYSEKDVFKEAIIWKSTGAYSTDRMNQNKYDLVEDFQEILEESQDAPENPKVTQGHPHAELMLQYAKDSLTNPEAWEEWEFTNNRSGWYALARSPSWHPENKYRKKQPMITVNGIKVKAGLKEEPEFGNKIYAVNLYGQVPYAEIVYNSWYSWVKDSVHNNLVFDNPEDAIAMTKALLSFKKD
jgi:hypothetical protein